MCDHYQLDPCTSAQYGIFMIALLVLVIVYAIVFGSDTLMRVLLGYCAAIFTISAMMTYKVAADMR